MHEWFTLESYVVQLIRNKQTNSSEFQTLLRIYGRDKIEEIYKKHFTSPTSCVKVHPVVTDNFTKR